MIGLDFWKNLRVVVTGGSAGLGRELAVQAADAGAKVAVVARDAEKLAAVHRARPDIFALQANVADKAATYRIAGAVYAALGGVDLLIHNASALGPTPLQLPVDTACEDLELALATNVVGAMRLTKALLPSMLLNGRGLVIAITSDASVNAYPTWGAYGASKAALDQMMRVLDAEVKGQGVRAFAIDPGDMRTALHFAAVPDADPKALQDPKDVAEQMLRFLSRTSNFEKVRWDSSAWKEQIFEPRRAATLEIL